MVQWFCQVHMQLNEEDVFSSFDTTRENKRNVYPYNPKVKIGGILFFKFSFKDFIVTLLYLYYV